jgi:quinol monooxygenase YgiN
MIVVLGTVTGDPATVDELVAASLAHVRRSRTEPGCVSHDVARDAENPLRLLFTERWESRAALQTHFEVPGSGEFVATARRLSHGQLGMNVYAIAD